MIVQDEFPQAVRAFFVELVAFHAREHGPKNLRTQDVGEGVAAFAAQPEQQFAARRVLVDEAGERFLEQVHLALRNQQAGKFAAQFRGNEIQRPAQHFRPALGVRGLERLQGMMMFRGGNLFHHRAKLDVLGPDLRRGDFVGRRRQPGDFAQFIARKNGFQRDRRLRALVRQDVRVQRGDDFAGGALFVGQIRRAFRQFGDDHDPRLQTLCRAEIGHQPRLQRYFLRLEDDRLGLFQGHDEMAVLFHFAPRGFPPLLPVIANHIRHQRVLDLVRRCLAAVAVQHELDQIQVMRGQLAHVFQVVGFARQNVVLGDGLEALGGEAQIHGVPRLANKINGESRKHRVHRLDASETPAAVHATSAFRQQGERLHMAAFNLARRGQFLEFFSHKSLLTRVHKVVCHY